MIPGLAALLTGDLARHADALTTRDDPRGPRPLAELLRPPALEAMLAHYAARHGEGDRRGVVSEWSKAYFARLLPPVLVAILVLGRELPLAIDEVELVLDADARPLAWKLPGPGYAAVAAAPHADPFARFDTLVVGHLEPLIGALARHGGLAPRVLWSNAGNYLEWLVGALDGRAPEAALHAGRTLLQSRHRPDGGLNPLHEPVRYVQARDADGRPVRWRRRRVCCLRYLVPGRELCTNCPLLKGPPA